MGFIGLGGLYLRLVLRIARICNLYMLSVVKSISSQGRGGKGYCLGGDIREVWVPSEEGNIFSSFFVWTGDL